MRYASKLCIHPTPRAQILIADGLKIKLGSHLRRGGWGGQENKLLTETDAKTSENHVGLDDVCCKQQVR